MTKDPIVYQDTSDDRALDLRPDGVDVIPLLGKSSYRSVHAGPEYHIHDGCMEYCLCLKGNLTFDSLGNEYPFLPGHIFVSSPRQPHHLRHNPSGLKTYRILFAIPKRGQRILNLASAESAWLVRALTHPPKRLFASSPRIRAAFERLFLLYDSEPRATNGRRVRMKSASLELLVALADAAHQQPRQKAPANIAALARRIMEKPNADYPVAAMAAEANLSVSAFSEAFKRAMGLPLHAYLLNCRIARAKELLADTNRSISAIAQELRFYSTQHFSTMFKRIVGQTPIQARTPSTPIAHQRRKQHMKPDLKTHAVISLLFLAAFAPSDLPADPAAVSPGFSFVYNGRTVTGIPADWTRQPVRTTCDARDGARRSTASTTAVEPATGLALTVDVTRYQDDPVVEWTISFENRGKANTSRFTRISSGDFVLPFAPEVPRTLYRGIGETGMKPQPFADEKNHSFWYETLTNATETTLTAERGFPSFLGFPYYRVFSPTNGYTVAVGWQGAWESRLTPDASGGVRNLTGQRTVDFYLKPGEKIIAPTVTVLAFTDRDNGVNAWRRFMRRWILPREKDGRVIRPILGYDAAFGGRLYEGITSEGTVDRIRRARAKGLRFDALWVDAGWYCRDDIRVPTTGERGGWFAGTGDWRCDPKRFPEGSFARVSEELAKDNALLILWYEPERIMAYNPLYPKVRNHLVWHGDTVIATNRIINPHLRYDLTRPDVVDYLAGVLNASIAANRVGFYRQDHNFAQIDQHWRDRIDKPRNDGRRGLAENLYIQGEFALWRRLRDANPGMKFDTCSGGGRRNDLSTLRFPSVPLHYTDTGYTNYVHKLHYHQMLAEWMFYRKDLPYFYHSRPKNFIDYRKATIDFPSLHVVPSYVFLDKDARHAEEELAFNAVWRELAPLLTDGDFYLLTREVTPDVDGDRIWWAAQYHDPARDCGFIKVVRSPRNDEVRLVLTPKGLTPGRTYRLTDSFASVEKRASYPCPTLVGGQPITLEQPADSGTIYTYAAD